MVLSIPHSGRDYPDWLIAQSRSGLASLEPLEDPWVDRLAWRAIRLGVAAVVARAPRAAIDCNRAEDEIDPAIIEGCWSGPLSPRARGGLGIVPARTQQHGHLWRRAISRGQLAERLDQAYRPFHHAVAAQLGAIAERFGCALLLDCHSMPPGPDGAPALVFGNCHGLTAAGWLSQEAARVAAEAGYASAHNDPFAGGHIVARHGRPDRGIHALQIEFDRRCYLDADARNPGPGFDAVASLLERIVERLGSALSGERFATAAE